MSLHKPQRLPRGLTMTPKGWRLTVAADGRVIQKRLPRSVTLEAAAEHLRALRHVHSAQKSRLQSSPGLLETMTTRRAPRGWCFVYFVRQQGDLVKIGQTTDIDARLREFRTSNGSHLELLACVAAHPSLEAHIHHLFRDTRVRGEWFTLSDELGSFIADLQSGMNPIEVLWRHQAHSAMRAAFTRRQSVAT